MCGLLLRGGVTSTGAAHNHVVVGEMAMRYSELREGRETLINAINYQRKADNPSAVQLLREALRDVRDEMKHPELFNPDGSRRTKKFYDSANGPINCT